MHFAESTHLLDDDGGHLKGPAIHSSQHFVGSIVVDKCRARFIHLQGHPHRQGCLFEIHIVDLKMFHHSPQ